VALKTIKTAIQPTPFTKWRTLTVHQGLGLGLWCLTPFSTIVQLYILAVSFNAGGHHSTPWKQPPYCKSLTNFIT